MAERLPPGVRTDVPLAPMTTLGIGGPARYFAAVSHPLELRELVRWQQDSGLPLWILGGGSNVVIADEGLPGLVLVPADNSVDLQEVGDDVQLVLGAGVTWDDAVQLAVDQSLAGIECLSGIPGLCGAAPMQNIGAYGQQLSDVLVHADVLDLATLTVDRWTAEDCAFGYRDSALKRAGPGRHIVLSIALKLRRGGPPTIHYPDLQRRLGEGASLADTRRAVLQVRASKGMVVDRDDPDSRSAGSFFVNPVVSSAQADRAQERLTVAQMPRWSVDGGEKLSAAWLIERSGMPRSYGDGRVGLSSKHTLALVNRGGATAAELVTFARHVQDRVLQATGIALTPEPRLLGLTWEDRSATR